MVCQKLNPGQKDDEKGLTLLLVHIISVRTRWKHVSLEEIHTKSLKGRLIGGDDLLCDGDMAVLAIRSSFLVTPNPKCLQSLLERQARCNFHSEYYCAHTASTKVKVLLLN